MIDVQTFSLALHLTAVRNESLDHAEFGTETDHKHTHIQGFF
jgi:hypothetical protein